MPPSAEATLQSLQGYLTNLEQLCNEIEVSLRSADMDHLSSAIAESRRVMHAFENAMADAKPLRTAAIDREIFARLQRIYSVRSEQMERLTARRDELGGKLQTLSRWKEYSRSIAGSDALKTKPRIFEDLR